MDKIQFTTFDEYDTSEREPDNACRCSNCQNTLLLKNCPSEWESESWEMPQQYLVHTCSLCGDGGLIEEYFHVGRVRAAFLGSRIRLKYLAARENFLRGR